MKVLIVDDNDVLRSTMARLLRRLGHETVMAATCAEARERLADDSFEVVFADVSLPDGLGFEVVDHVNLAQPDCDVVVMTGHVQIDHAITAMRHGAADFLTKPFSAEALAHVFERLEDTKRFDMSTPPQGDDRADWRARCCPEILGEDPALLRVFDIVRRVADTDCPVLITGETGTGKELFAQAIHRSSDRGDGPFVPVNCASVPENLMETELFGHAKGAFTGATGQYEGRFAIADGGTLLLDEIGEMHTPLQAKLLRVLQEGEIRPVGDRRTRKIDVRVIAATHRDIEAMVDTGAFREDLLYRLDVIRIELPSLRHRPGDIEILTHEFIQQVAAHRKRNVTDISPDALAALKTYQWPGNIRQLKHTLQRMVVLANAPVLTIDDVPSRIRDHAEREGASNPRQPILPPEGLDLRSAVEDYENELIRQALERTGWNKNQAASMLQMNRTTLVEKVKKRGLGPGESAA